MDPLEFQQDTIIRQCAFRIASSASTLADADDVQQILRERLLAFDTSKLPGDCKDPKAWAFRYVQLRTLRETRSRDWMRSDSGKFKHISIDSMDHEPETRERDETCVYDAETIRCLLSNEEWRLIEMRYYEGMTFKEIGARLNLSQRGACARHAALVSLLRERLGIV